MPTLSTDAARRRLYEIAAAPEADVAEGALCIAAEEYPDLDLACYLAFVADLADSARAAAGRRADAESCRRALTDEIFGRLGFVGDSIDDRDPRNSHLNQVIDRRCGVPVTLAIVYLAAASRLEQPVAGIAAPGHFLVRHGTAILDPFHGGRLVPPEELVGRLRAQSAPDPGAAAIDLLRHPPDARAMLSRVLANLRTSHLRHRNLPLALAAIDRLVHLNPDEPHWLRERAALHQHLDCPRAAIADLERYFELAPHDPEADVLRHALVDLMRNLPPLH